MFMPSNPQDTNNLASREAYNAALEVEAGVAEFVFQQLCEHPTLISDSDMLVEVVRRAQVVYAGNASALSRLGHLLNGVEQMRMNMDKPLVGNKMGSPVEGRLSSKEPFAERSFLAAHQRMVMVG